MSATTLITLHKESTKPISIPRTARIESIDLLRGTVMIIMALDHVRHFFHETAFVYDPVDLQHTNAALFFTRWTTNFCAPVFIFLAGVSAYLYGARRSTRDLSYFLFTRGLWLVFVELFIVTLASTFNVEYAYFNLSVIWAIGICMILMSAMVYLDIRWILSCGLIIVAGHNLLDNIHVPGLGVDSFLWSLLHEPGYFQFPHASFKVVYPVIPWIGVMAIGYAFGRLFTPGYDARLRREILLCLGIAMVVLFFVLRFFNLYGQAAAWSPQGDGVLSVLSFLNLTKYPPSLMYLLSTLGPAFIFLSLAQNRLNRLAVRVCVFGRVPMFYYLIHLPVIHSLAILAAVSTGTAASALVIKTMRISEITGLSGYGFGLPVVYLVWIAIVLMLYPVCKWFDAYRTRYASRQWWLSYL